MEGNPVPQHTIDQPPFEIRDIGRGDGKVIIAVAGDVHVAASLHDHRGWIVTSTLAREVPQLVAKDEDDARAFLVFLAELYTGRIVQPRVPSPALAGYLACEGIEVDPVSDTHDVTVEAPVTVSVDLDALVKASGYVAGGYNHDTEEYEPGGGLVEMVANLIATKLKADIRKEVVAAVNDQVQAQVGAIVTEVIEGTIKVTNAFGEPTGGPMTLRERIIKEARDVLDRRVNENGSYDRYSGRDSMTLVNYIAKKAAKEAITGELKTAADQAVAEVKQGIRDLVGAQITDRIAAAVTQGLSK